MKYRKLRIAWSVAWGVVALGLAIFWGRSYWWKDSAYIRLSNSNWYVGFQSDEGQVCLGLYKLVTPGSLPIWQSVTNNVARMDSLMREILDVREGRTDRMDYTTFWGVESSHGRTEVRVRHWIAILLLVALSAVSWIRLPKRFSLRTLLIATTLVAVALGLIVWAAK